MRSLAATLTACWVALGGCEDATPKDTSGGAAGAAETGPPAVRGAFAVMTTKDAPGGRILPGATWTGSEMVVFGGAVPLGPIQSTFRYQPGGRPEDEAWHPLSRSGAPGARRNPFVLWTGSEVLVWGGEVLGIPQSGGARWDPTKDTWTRMNATHAPAPRLGWSGIWTGSEMIVWGGTQETRPVARGARWRAATDDWVETPLEGAPTPRAGHTAVWTGSEMVAWGGAELHSPDGSMSGGALDPKAGIWRALALAGAPAARTDHAATFCGGHMLIVGGLYATLSRNDSARWDPVTDTWTTLPRKLAPSPRTGHTLVCAGATAIVWGGLELPRGQETDSGAIYDFAAEAWSSTNRVGAPFRRRYHAAVFTGSEMLVWGGSQANRPIIATEPGGRLTVEPFPP